MFQRNLQLSVHPNALSAIEPSKLMTLDWSSPRAPAEGEMQKGNLLKVESVVGYSQRLQDDLQKLGIKIKKHEENLRFLKTQIDQLDESILDMQVSLGNCHSSNGKSMENDGNKEFQNEEKTIEQILQQEKSAAGVVCQLRSHHGTQAPHLPLTKEVLGTVATLGKVNDDNLSRLFSEYLGLETMMAIVCKTREGVKALETYDSEGEINKSTGLHGLGSSIGRHVDGRFLVISLEDLRQESPFYLLNWAGNDTMFKFQYPSKCIFSCRPYSGDLIADDPQRRLAILKPRLPSGKCPPGFLGFAVNMINLDNTNLYFMTAGGQGLRETLFYRLFFRLQVYRTRAEMELALPCISDGALSLDGGIIRSNGVYYLGSREEVKVRFPVSSGPPVLSIEYVETAGRIKTMAWDRERVTDDMQREQTLLDHSKRSFELKKQEYVKFLAESSSLTVEMKLSGGVFASQKEHKAKLQTAESGTALLSKYLICPGRKEIEEQAVKG
ncbi:hypothetical protein Sjap_021159 [Stephania japonica]|uniref:Uncharacterized protein n=1 Tax=Stephania japonica TaxID=461633 RepID=A0AAP0I100_9MAGN